jgi:hypothetical protein
LTAAKAELQTYNFCFGQDFWVAACEAPNAFAGIGRCHVEILDAQTRVGCDGDGTDGVCSSIRTDGAEATGSWTCANFILPAAPWRKGHANSSARTLPISASRHFLSPNQSREPTRGHVSGIEWPETCSAERRSAQDRLPGGKIDPASAMSQFVTCRVTLIMQGHVSPGFTLEDFGKCTWDGSQKSDFGQFCSASFRA